MRAQSGTYGTQPAKGIINRNSKHDFMPRDGRAGRIVRTARLLGEVLGREVKAGTLQAWLDGRNLPPAEVKIGLAQLLGVEIERCWTPEVLAATYVGPRGGVRHAAKVSDPT